MRTFGLALYRQGKAGLLSKSQPPYVAIPLSYPVMQVTVPKMPETKAVLVDVAASDSHPGYLVRLAGDR